jgi:Flp pilus assembly protein TadD
MNWLDPGRAPTCPQLRSHHFRLSPNAARHFVCMAKVLRAQGLTREADQVLDSGIAAGRDAVRLRPDDAFHHNTLATALGQRGLDDEAVAELQTAIRLRPQFPSAHHNLGINLLHQGHVNDAIAEFRTAILLEPDDHKAHSSLGSALCDLGRMDEAIAEYRETVRLMPEEGVAHHNLGVALFHQGRVDEALAEYRETIRLSPNFAEAHYNLADTLRLKGQVDKAVEEYRAAIKLKPDFAEAHCNLATQLKAQGRFAESLAEFERGHELGSKRADWPYASPMWIDQVRRLVRIDHDFAALMRGDVKPASVTDRLDFAYVAHTRGFHATSARLWAESLGLQPTLSSDSTGRLRYAAARCAVLACCGQGKEEPPPDEAAKSGFRRQAREWLAADLAVWSKILATGSPRVRSTVQHAIQAWKIDTALADVRAPDVLAKLPAAEQAEWRKLWAEVERLLANSRDAAPDTKTEKAESGDRERPP